MCVSLSLNSTDPSSQRAAGQEGKREKFSIPAASAKNSAVNSPEKQKDREEQGTVHSIYSGFLFSGPVMPPAHINNQTSISGLKQVSKRTNKTNVIFA